MGRRGSAPRCKPQVMEVLWASEGPQSEATRGARTGIHGRGHDRRGRCAQRESSSPSFRRTPRSSSPNRSLRSRASSSTRTRSRLQRRRSSARRSSGSSTCGIVGGPPAPRLYLSGAEAERVAALFAQSPVETLGVSNAFALKCAYAAWTKGSAALLLAVREFAQAEGVWEPLAEEWTRSQPQLAERLAAAERSAATKGWRWIGRWRRSPTPSPPTGFRPGSTEAAAVIYNPVGTPGRVPVGPQLARLREAEVDLRRGRVGPARRDDLAARVEVDPLGPVDVPVAEERRLPAAEASSTRPAPGSAR